MAIAIYGDWNDPYAAEVMDAVTSLDSLTSAWEELRNSRNLRMEAALEAELDMEEIIAFWHSWANSATNPATRHARETDAAAAEFLLRGGYETIFGPIRFGEGFASGTAGGYATDILRLVSVVGPAIRVLSGGARLVGISQLARSSTCAFNAVGQAVRATGIRYLFKLKDLLKAVSRVLSRLARPGEEAVVTEETINWIFRGTDVEMFRVLRAALRDLRIAFNEHSFRNLGELYQAVRSNGRRVFAFGAEFEHWIRDAAGNVVETSARHMMYATRVGGRTVVFDTNGASYATFEALEAAYPGIRLGQDVPALEFVNAFIFNLMQVEAAAARSVAPTVIAEGALAGSGAMGPGDDFGVALEVIPPLPQANFQVVQQVEGPHRSYRSDAEAERIERIDAHQAAPFLYLDELLDHIRDEL